MAAPLAFLIAGILAAFSGLSYAELGQRLPDAAGAAVYAQKGFQSSLAGRLTGYATLLVAVVSAASVPRGGAGYLLATTFDFEPLARVTSALILIIFVIVNMSLVMLKRRHEPVKLSLKIPAWVPIFGALSSLAVLIAELFWTA